jgi:enediyne biosynthesis protein E4
MSSSEMATAFGVRELGTALIVIFGFLEFPRQGAQWAWLLTFVTVAGGLPKRYQAEAPQRLRRFGFCAGFSLLPPLWLSLATAFSGHGLTHNQPVSFADITQSAKIAFRHENGASAEKLMVETFGSGVAWLDYDNDGFLDLFFANGANLSAGKPSPGNALLRNTGKGTFVDVTQSAGLKGDGGFSAGVAVGDYDNDGFLDLYVTGYGANTLYHNNGNGTFTDVTAKAGVKGGGWSSSAGFFDYDRDGDLDLYVVRYLDYDVKENVYCGYQKPGYRMYCDPRGFDGVPDLLYRNNGDGTFTDVSKKAGVANPAGKGLGVAFGDFDNDGWPDIFVANDLVRNFLYRNNGDGTFTDLAYSAGVGYDPNGNPRAGMGTEFADFDGDGRLDLFVTNFSEELNALFRNRGDLTFEEVSEQAGLGSGFLPLGFGTKLFDFDNDGDVDIYVTNGHVVDNVQLYNPRLSYMQTDLLYANDGGHFRDVSAASGPAFQIKHVGRGAATGDFDNDGDLDIIVSNCGQPPMLMRNDGGNKNHWIAIKARGRESNSFGVGARVKVEAGGRTRIKEIYSAGSYLSGSDLRLYFGLGGERKIKQVEILWPSGKKQILNDVAADQVLSLDEAQAQRK